MECMQSPNGSSRSNSRDAINARCLPSPIKPLGGNAQTLLHVDWAVVFFPCGAYRILQIHADLRAVLAVCRAQQTVAKLTAGLFVAKANLNREATQILPKQRSDPIEIE